MSSPNLNVVTLLGSVLTYTSAYLFGIQEQSLESSGKSVEMLIQVSRDCQDGCPHTCPHAWTWVGAGHECQLGPCRRVPSPAPFPACSCGSACCVWGPLWCLGPSWERAGGSTRCSPRGCQTSGW